MKKKRDLTKKNEDNVAIVQNIKNLIYENNMTLVEGMATCGYKTSHNIFNKWESTEGRIPMESLVKIASGLGVDLFRLAPPSYFGIAEKTETSPKKRYEQSGSFDYVEENNILKDYIRLLQKEKNDLQNEIKSLKNE